MGQYIGIYNRTKKQYVTGKNEGAKLLEKMSLNPTSGAMRLAKLLSGPWAGDDVVVQGDYAEKSDPKFISKEKLKGYLEVEFIPESNPKRYFIGQREGSSGSLLTYYVDTKNNPELALIAIVALYNSNGRGGGDLVFNDYVCLDKRVFQSVKVSLSVEDGIRQGALEELCQDFLRCDFFAFVDELPEKTKEAHNYDLTPLAKLIIASSEVGQASKRLKAESKKIMSPILEEIAQKLEHKRQWESENEEIGVNVKPDIIISSKGINTRGFRQQK